ncbi:unnamed protein product [Schistosoma margrebowiei]|uniref:Uncharacterized protein n=1 Tax=Schistosoma margrebowiei TaxID=48269 RepID=A0A183LIH5_9TREM|nr:unnamed protein product [Schistosoma margrebowiei]
MSVIQCYALIDETDEENKDQFDEWLKSIVDKCPITDPTILMADINAKVEMDNIGYDNIMRRHRLGLSNGNGEGFSILYAFEKMVIGGTIFLHKRKYKVT